MRADDDEIACLGNPVTPNASFIRVCYFLYIMSAHSAESIVVYISPQSPDDTCLLSKSFPFSCCQRMQTI